MTNRFAYHWTGWFWFVVDDGSDHFEGFFNQPIDRFGECFVAMFRVSSIAAAIVGAVPSALWQIIGQIIRCFTFTQAYSHCFGIVDCNSLSTLWWMSFCFGVALEMVCVARAVLFSSVMKYLNWNSVEFLGWFAVYSISCVLTLSYFVWLLFAVRLIANQPNNLICVFFFVSSLLGFCATVCVVFFCTRFLHSFVMSLRVWRIESNTRALSLIHTMRIDEFILFSHVYILFTIIVDEKSTNHINEPSAVAANDQRMNEQNEKKQ